MHQDESETAGTIGLRLPMAMTKHAATIRGVNLNGFGDKRKPKGRPRQIVAHDRLQVSVEETTAGRKSGKPFRCIAVCGDFPFDHSTGC